MTCPPPIRCDRRHANHVEYNRNEKDGVEAKGTASCLSSMDPNYELRVTSYSTSTNSPSTYSRYTEYSYSYKHESLRWNIAVSSRILSHRGG